MKIVSIIIPLHNAEAYILETLKSINKNKVQVNGAQFFQTTKCNDIQTEILNSLNVNF